jgi:tricorn protease
MKKIVLSILCILFLGFAFSQNDSRLLRFPTIHENQIVFTYAGDLFTVDSEGGIARKLTNHKGFEMFAHFSPDGETIAFTGQYDGNTEVYTIPSNGGIPKRITITATLNRDDISDRMGPNNIVMDWNPNGEQILYRSRKQSFNSFKGKLFTVNKDGGISNELPLPAGGFSSYSPDGQKLAYNKVFREFRTWKYYQGGMADDIWILDFNTKEIENITNNIAQDIIPMWYENKIYFASDRDRTMNIFEYNLDTKSTKKITNFTEYDVKFPSIGKSQIVFENGGYIYKLDCKSNEINKVNIEIYDDFIWSRPEIKDATKNLEAWNINSDGTEIAITARGDVYIVPTEEGATVNINESSESHERSGNFSPDNKFIAYISDKSGEDEVYIKNLQTFEEKQITSNSKAYKFSLKWSPDSKNIMFSDQKFNLFYANIESLKTTRVDTSESRYIRIFNWSPDSKWIVYAKRFRDTYQKICLYNIDTKNVTEITEGWYYSSNPVFSNDGNYILFTSNRHFSPIWNDMEWNHAYKDMTKIYFVTTRKDIVSPFTPKSNQKEFKNNPFTIDLEGITDRIEEIPVLPANYWNVNAIDGKVFYNVRKHNESSYSMKMYNLSDEKETLLGKMLSYELSSDNKKMLIKKSQNFYVIDLPGSEIKLSDKVSLSNVKTLVNKQSEWSQIFYESWRQMRDFFYAPNMHGLDWEAIKAKYEVLLPYVNHRADLSYIIGEMIGELNIGHAYIGQGDIPKPERINLGLLGANISKAENGYFKIDKILNGANWDPTLKSPLQQLGLQINENDYIIEINGKKAKNIADIYSELIDKAGKQVILKVSSNSEGKDSRKITVIPISDESNLYYYNWVKDNIEKVSKATDNQVGYIHLPDMMTPGLNQFAKLYYSQINKKAFIIDNRGNGGGNVSPMIIERLKRQPDYYTMRGEADYGHTNPGGTFLGPKIMITNEYAASDGDLVAYRFKKNNLGKIIGKRSWGGTVGIGPSLPFVDGTDLRIPILAPYSLDGKEWIVEGWGVEPDIEVENNPIKEYLGEDEQLNKAIELILEELKEKEVVIPGLPDYPDKTK